MTDHLSPWCEALIAQMIEADRSVMDLLNRLANFHDAGGERRKRNGKHTEDLVQMMLTGIMLNRFLGIEFCIKRNSDTQKKKRIRFSIFFLPNGQRLDVSLDLHLYVEERFVLAIESKAYLDGNMAKATVFNAERLKKNRSQLKCLVVEAEHALKRGAWESYRNCGFLNGVFQLTEGMRNSQRPKYRIDKCIRRDRLVRLIDHAEEHLSSFMTDNTTLDPLGCGSDKLRTEHVCA